MRVGWEGIIVNSACFGKGSGPRTPSPLRAVKVLCHIKPSGVNTGCVSVWSPLTHNILCFKIFSKTWNTFEVSLIDLSQLLN